MQPRTIAAQLTRFQWMLGQCELYGWLDLAALIQAQIDKLPSNLRPASIDKQQARV